jgi:hypothetical protein
MGTTTRGRVAKALTADLTKGRRGRDPARDADLERGDIDAMAAMGARVDSAIERGLALAGDDMAVVPDADGVASPEGRGGAAGYFRWLATRHPDIFAALLTHRLPQPAKKLEAAVGVTLEQLVVGSMAFDDRQPVIDVSPVDTKSQVD